MLRMMETTVVTISARPTTASRRRGSGGRGVQGGRGSAGAGESDMPGLEGGGERRGHRRATNLPLWVFVFLSCLLASGGTGILACATNDQSYANNSSTTPPSFRISTGRPSGV